MTAAVEGRRVRVTVEGFARAVKHDSRYLYIKHGEHSFLVCAEAEGVTVEDVVPPRVWTDGDVVQTRLQVFERRDGRWRTTGSHLSCGDATMDGLVGGGSAKVLRYQAGDL